MHPNHLIVPLLKSCVLLGAAAGLYMLWHAHIATTVVVQDDDDINVAPHVIVHVGTISRSTLRKYLNVFGVVQLEPARRDQPAEAESPRPIIAASVPASELSAVKLGQDVFIDPPSTTTMPSAAPAGWSGRVTFIDPAIDPKSGMGTVDISIPAGARLSLGQILRVRIVTDEHRDCLTVPVESLVNDAQGNPGISVVVRDFRWAVRDPVQVGLREDDRVEIRGQDLKEGMSIVTTGAFALRDKTMIEVEK